MISEGDEKAQEILYKKYIILISKKIKDYNLSSEYDDVFQESLIVLNKTVEKYKDGPYKFYSYFCRALENRLISYKRGMNKINRVLFVEDNSVYLNDHSDARAYESIDDILKCLKDNERKIVKMKYIENWSIKEIADEFNCSEAKIYLMISKIREKIRNFLG